MQTAYSTIITADFLHYALALRHSLARFKPDVVLTVLVADEHYDAKKLNGTFEGMYFLSVCDLCADGLGKQIFDKYFRLYIDGFRWSMKPVVLNYLLESGYDQAFFLDPDLFFFADFSFIESDLDKKAVLLTPHWRASKPMLDENNFAILQTSGLFNAGFIGVTAAGRTAMDWWARVCLYRCEKQPTQGLYVDQAYLDMMPIYFDDVVIERHRGCNVANWNRVECARIVRPDGVVGIKGGWDIVFIHFTQSTINGIESGVDALLRPFLTEYLASVQHWRQEVGSCVPDLTVRDDTQEGYWPNNNEPHQQQTQIHTPRLQLTSLDLYHIRSRIETALRQVLPDLHGSVLDVGCGQMPYKPLLTAPPSQVTRYIGLDLQDNPIHNNRPDITWQDGRIPLEDDSIDCAICTEVLEHCPDPEAVLREVCRILKPDGLLFFTVPFLWPLHEVPYDQYRYTPYALERHLSNAGFAQIEIRALGGWDASLAQMLGLWVRRRPMHRWLRAGLSLLAWPLIWVLLKVDAQRPTIFRESVMITGLSGTARKLFTDISD